MPEVQVGQYVIVHVGFALSTMDEEEALKTLRLFEEMGNALDELGEDETEAPPPEAEGVAMRYLDEYRDAGAARGLAGQIRAMTTRPWTIMEICGGQTHTIVKYALEEMLPDSLTLVHGPGCPVCVTPLEMIDRAIAIASRPGVIFTSFGDMLRVPGSTRDLLSVKAERGSVRVVYSPLDAVRIAQENPQQQVVFFAVGFETTAPPNAMAVYQARKLGLSNFSILCSHVLVPPAMHAILSSPANRVQGFLAAGHVCTVMGYEEYLPIAEQYRVPDRRHRIRAAGYFAGDLDDRPAARIRSTVEVENQYTRSVRREGNPAARRLLAEVFEVTDRKWRGIGTIRASGYRLKEEFADFDAERRLRSRDTSKPRNHPCVSPVRCSRESSGRRTARPSAGSAVREHPLGAPMVSSEGACAAYYQFASHAT